MAIVQHQSENQNFTHAIIRSSGTYPLFCGESVFPISKGYVGQNINNVRMRTSQVDYFWPECFTATASK